MPVVAKDKNEIEALEVLSKRLKGKLEYRRLQCVLLSLKHSKTPSEIAELLQIHLRTVYKHLERYRLEGMNTFEAQKCGQKTGPKLMNAQEEKALLKTLEEEAGDGQILTGLKVKERYEEVLGKPVALSTIYVVLHRNNWSRKRPPPKDPKGDEEAKSLFKKTTRIH